MSKRKGFVYGVGVNDSQEPVYKLTNGVRLRCPFYSTWVRMLKRCYCPKYHALKPSYAGCSVATEWLSFSNFKSWMREQDWEGKHLDKDILTPGNKVYSAQTCCFVEPSLNQLLAFYRSKPRGLPPGVSLDKWSGRYRAQCHDFGRALGRFETPQQAHVAYALAKSSVIRSAAQEQSDRRVSRGLLKHARALVAAAQEKA